MVDSASDRYPPTLWEAKVKAPLAIAAVLIGAALLISFVAGYSFALTRDEQSGTLEMGPIEAVPSENLPGQDVPGMQRYPGAVRVKYGSHLLGEKRVSEAGYLSGYLSEGEVGWRIKTSLAISATV